MCVTDVKFVPFLDLGKERTGHISSLLLLREVVGKQVDSQYVCHKGKRASLNSQDWERVKFVSVSGAIYARNKMNIFIIIDLGIDLDGEWQQILH